MTARTIAVLAAAGLLGAARAGADEMQQPKASTPSQQEREVRQEAPARESRAASSATATQGQASAAASKQGQEAAVAGKVADVSTDTLTVKTDDGRSVTLRVTGSTQVTVDGRQRSIGDLTEGEQVRASYDATSGDRTAIQIDATR